MIKIEIFLSDGQRKVEELEVYNPIEIEEIINDRETHMILIGDSLYNKGLIKLISPYKEEIENK